MCWAGQGCASQGQEPSALHPVTTAQHDCCFDGTAMAPWRREYKIVLGIVDRLIGRV
jgi:hypothetical protein